MVNNKPSNEWNEDDVKAIQEFIANEEALKNARETEGTNNDNVPEEMPSEDVNAAIQNG